MPSSNYYKCMLGCPKNGPLYRFPSNPERRQIWLKCVKLEYSIYALKQSGMYLCGNHFTSDHFSDTRLRRHAIPTLNLEHSNLEPIKMDDDEEDEDNDDIAVEIISSSDEGDSNTAIQYSTNVRNKTLALPNHFNTIKLKKEQAKKLLVAIAKEENIKAPKKFVKLKKKQKIKSSKKKTPLATYEMVMTTRELEKMDMVLPKLPTAEGGENSMNESTRSGNETATAVGTLNLPISLPKGITIKPLNGWKAQAENLRKTIQEKIKKTNTEIPAKECLQRTQYIETLRMVDPKDANLSVDRKYNIYNSFKKDKSTMAVPNPRLKTITMYSEATQTNKEDFQGCALMQFSSKSNSFSIKCFQCTAEFECPKWREFAKHFRREHPEHLRPPDPEITKAHETVSQVDEDKLFKIVDKNAENDIFVIDEDLQSTQDNMIGDNFDDLIEFDAFSLSSWENDDATEDGTAIADFKRCNAPKTLKFLQTLYKYPLLWHPRRYGPNAFDNEAKNFFNEYEEEMSMVDFRNSLENLRNLHRRFTPMTPAKETKLAKAPHLRKFLKIIDEIVLLSKSHEYHCDECTYYFLDESSLLKHKFKKHKDGFIAHVCSCGLHFADAAGREAHENTHKSEASFACEHCGLLFFSTRKLENHKIHVHPETVADPLPYKCKNCDEKFAKQYMLKWHNQKNHNPPRYKCDKCEKTFYNGYPYNIHLKKHLNQRDFVCEDCGKAYFQKSELVKHRTMAHKAGEHQCEPCRTSFASYENLYMHMQKHHPNGTNLDRQKKLKAAVSRRYLQRKRGNLPPGFRQYKCKQCGMEFERLRELMRHNRELGHSNPKARRYKCPHCGSIIRSTQTFAIHLRRKHDIEATYADVKCYEPYIEEDPDNEEENVEVIPLTGSNVEIISAIEEEKYAVNGITINEDVKVEYLREYVNEYEYEKK